MTSTFKLTLIWILGSLAALVVALAPLSGAFVDGHYIPTGDDSFYHARRILDAVADPGRFYQFDPRMHVPEGSLISWPWAYDWVMSLLVRAGLLLHAGTDPMAILDNLPVLAFVLAVTIMLVVCRQLRLGPAATALALLATAFFPLNQTLYGVGDIDQHYAEHLFVLASLAGGLAWLGKPESHGRACLAGAILGLASGVHTALFILQVPLVLCLAWGWVRGLPLPKSRTAPTFTAALVAASLVIGLPSLPLREGHFELYTLSWFQVYFAVCTGLVVILLSRIPFSRRNAWLLAGLVFLMAVPAISQILFAGRVLTDAIADMDEISEVRSPWYLLLHPDGVRYVSRFYTVAIFLIPATLAWSAWGLWRATGLKPAFFWIASLFGLLLLLQQFRLNYFGSFALYLPWIMLADQQAHQRPAQARIVLGLLSLGLLLAYAPGAGKLFQRHVAADDKYYQVTRRIYVALADECRRNPGTVLADPFDGHYIRFHTECSVIANPFLLTPQQERKFLEERQLLSLSAAQLLQTAPYLRYVYVRRNNLFYIGPGHSTVITPTGNPSDPDPPLVHELLTANAAELPPHFRLVKELEFPGYESAPYARLFALDSR